MEHNAATLRVLAERSREAAGVATDPELRQLLLDAATDYDLWASLL